jgi:hypothetical protein
MGIVLMNYFRSDLAISSAHDHVRIVKGKDNKQRRVAMDLGTPTQLREYVTENAIGENELIFPISQQWATMIVKRYKRFIDLDSHPHVSP